MIKGRSAIAVARSAALLIGTAVSAGATASVNGDHGRRDHGYVQVCQRIREDDGHGGQQARHDDEEFIGRYRVTDSEGDRSTVRLEGRRACRQLRVHSGRVRVRVIDEPDNTDLRGDRQRTVRVRRGETETVTFRYRRTTTSVSPD
jgi:hypothetical protein